jgi:DNA-binding FadR family transcriptional regulator
MVIRGVMGDAASANPPTTRNGGPVNRPYKRSELVAREIIENLIADGLVSGDLLPSETQMLEHYQVGRASLREALRLLEAQGLITLKPGPGGGPVVGDVNPAHLGRTASLYFRMGGATFHELIETVLVLEPWLAELAAQRSDKEVARARLRHAMDETDALRGDVEGVIRTAPGFHRVVHELSGNPVLSTMTGAIDAVFTDQILCTLDLGPHQEQFLEDHHAIAEAIIAGDSLEARRLADEHAQRIAACAREQAGSLLDRRIEWR